MHIFGLPIHLWAGECFEIVGERCNGLIQVDERTEKMLDLRFVRIVVTNKHLTILLHPLTVVVNEKEYCPSAVELGGDKSLLAWRQEMGPVTLAFLVAEVKRSEQQLTLI